MGRYEDLKETVKSFVRYECHPRRVSLNFTKSLVSYASYRSDCLYPAKYESRFRPFDSLQRNLMNFSTLLLRIEEIIPIIRFTSFQAGIVW